jgi:hypothetical protein
MSADLPLVSQVMYLREGGVEPGDEARVERLERKISDWERDVSRKVKKERTTSREDLVSDMVDTENNLKGYWCEGEKCLSSRTHWVLHSSETICCDCWHDPCACAAPLEWDEAEQAYYNFFLSCDGKTKNNFWLSEPTSDQARMAFKRKEKNERENRKRKIEEEECADNQQTAKKEGFCCHQHAKRMKLKEEEVKECSKGAQVDGPDHCIHCDEDPCVFIQIESRLWENDTIYYDRYEYENAPVTYNSGRRKRAYQYAAFVLWEGINHRRPHYKCVENGVRALFPPLDGKIMGYKSE